MPLFATRAQEADKAHWALRVATRPTALGISPRKCKSGLGKRRRFGGECIRSPGIANSYTFTGRRLDDETGLFYYRNRYYHAQLGRFVTRDPIGYDGSEWNLYEYVRSGSVNRVDPTGLSGQGWLEICSKDVEGLKKYHIEHLYLVLEFPSGTKWGYRSGPGETTFQCDLDYEIEEQLIHEHGRYSPGWIDYTAPSEEKCRTVRTGGMRASKIHKCFVKYLDELNACCIEYSPVIFRNARRPFRCNSNCTIYWLLTKCIENVRFDPAKLPFPGRMPWGFGIDPPDCKECNDSRE